MMKQDEKMKQLDERDSPANHSAAINPRVF
jgi:hypothetical protein